MNIWRQVGGTSEHRFRREVQTLGMQLEVERMECGALEGPRSGAICSQTRSFGITESVVLALLKSSNEAARWATTLLAQSAMLRDCCQSVLKNVTVAGNGRARRRRGLRAGTDFRSQSCGLLAFAQDLGAITVDNLHVTGKGQRKATVYQCPTLFALTLENSVGVENRQ